MTSTTGDAQTVNRTIVSIILSIAGWILLFYGLHNCMDCIGHVS